MTNAKFSIPHTTYILMWNPEISSTTFDVYREWLYSGEHVEPNWSVSEWENPTWDDDFFLVKCGGVGANGVVMKGLFNGLPYLAESWRGDNSFIFYRKLYIQLGFDPLTEPILETEVLKKETPDFNWEGGRSGRKLTKEQETKLKELWSQHLKDNKELVDRKDAHAQVCIDPRLKGKIKGFEKWQSLWSSYDEAVNIDTFHDSLNLSFSHDYEKSEFHIKAWVMPGNTMHIVAHKLQRIKIDLDNGSCFGDYISIWKLGDYIRISCNGIDLIAKDVEIKSIADYKGEWIPATI